MDNPKGAAVGAHAKAVQRHETQRHPCMMQRQPRLCIASGHRRGAL